MRLANGIIVDNEKTFGELKFSGFRRDVFDRNSDGELTSEVKKRTYDLKSKMQGDMIQVSIPGSIPKKEFQYNDQVLLVNPRVDTVAGYGKSGQEANWFIVADDILLVEKQTAAAAAKK